MASIKEKRAPVHVTKRSAIPSAATTDLDDEVPSDYLQDPELWRDPLPQPFRMIDEVLQNFLDDLWDEILRAERKRSEEALKPRIAVENALKEVTTPTLHGLLYVTFRSDPVLLVASRSGLHTIKTDHGGAYTELVPGTDNIEVFAMDGQQVNGIRGNTGDQYWILAATTKEGINHYLLYGDSFVQLRNTEFSSKERQPISCSLASGASHVTVIFKENVEYSLEVYQLPVSQWIGDFCSSLSKYRDLLSERAATEEDQEDQQSIPPYQPPDPASFAKPTFLKRFNQPPSSNHCSDLDPAFALSNIATDSKKCMSTGERHLVMDNYINNRMKVFLRSRSDFLTEPFSISDRADTKLPHSHFVYYKQGVCCEEPVSLLLWWEGMSHVAQYSLLHNSKAKDSTPVLERVWPQSSQITCSTMNRDGSLLALGLERGSVIILDLKSDIFHHIVTVRNDLTMTCVEFCSTTTFTADITTGTSTTGISTTGTSTTGTSATDTSTVTTTSLLLYVGTSSGAVYELNTSKQYGDRAVNYTQRVLCVEQPDCGSPVERIILRTHPSLFLVLHKDGTVMRLNAPLATIQPSLSSPTSSVDVGHFSSSPNGDFLAFGENSPGSQIFKESKVHILQVTPS